MTRTKKIFVGGLSVNTTIEDVKQYFDQFGKVSAAAIENFSSPASPWKRRGYWASEGRGGEGRWGAGRAS